MSSRDNSPVPVEWALWDGRTAVNSHSIPCSRGQLTEANFSELLMRYSPGTLDVRRLPEVTIGWTQDRNSGEYYVGLAIHRHSPEVEAGGREPVRISYFCLPFRAMAEEALSYETFYDVVMNVTLPAADAGPLLVNLPAYSADGLADGPRADLARLAAASLLTSEPICVLGADEVSYLDRLRFIDAVASFLPYGSRGRLSASTWTNSVSRSHKFRLFFANGDRGSGDRVLTWNQAGDGKIGVSLSDEYLMLLRGGRLTREFLAREITPRGFDRADVGMVLRLARRAHLSPEGDEPASAAPDGEETSAIEELFGSSGIALAVGDQMVLIRVIDELRSHLQAQISQEDRLALQAGIVAHHLLTPRIGVDDSVLCQFYVVLLQLAFQTPVKYPDYCRVEESAGYAPGERLHAPLAEALLYVRAEGATQLLLLNSLDDEEAERMAREYPIAPADSVAMMTGTLDPAHTEAVTAMALRNLRLTTKNGWSDRRHFAEALNDQKLVAVLQSRYSGDSYHLHMVLKQILQFAYNGALGYQDARKLLTGMSAAPSQALLGAMLATARPRDRSRVEREFAPQGLKRAGIADDTDALARHQESPRARWPWR